MTKLIVKGVVIPKDNVDYWGDVQCKTNQFTVGAKWNRGDKYYGVWGYSNLLCLFPAILVVLNCALLAKLGVLPSLGSLPPGYIPSCLFDWRGDV